ncbi:MAG: hypothetical protein AAGB13_03700 [Cyanobacteria bacterium P01_F01_bin.33]
MQHLDIRDTVQRWADGEANHGLGIVSKEIWGNEDSIRVFASEADEIMFRPALEVEFTV